MPPKISIITPSFNQAQYLEATLESVRKQSYTNYEHLVIDGGSTDGSKGILERWGKGLTYWESEPDRGQSHAINKGLARSTGEVLTWLNSDDQFFDTEVLAKVAQAFEENPNLDLLYGDCLLFDENGWEKYSRADPDPKRILGGMSFAQPASFFSRRSYQQFGPLSESLDFAMDYDFFLPVVQSGQTQYLPEVFARYLYHDTSKSVRYLAEFAREYSLVMQKFLDSIPEIEAAQHWIHELKAAQLWLPAKETTYKGLQTPTEEDIQTLVLNNVLSQVKYFYAAAQAKPTRKRIEWLKAVAPEFVETHPQLNTTLQRVRWLPAWMLRLWRNHAKK